jgi:hypothetical protein
VLSSSSCFVPYCFGALTVYAFKTSLDGQPILGKAGFDD